MAATGMSTAPSAQSSLARPCTQTACSADPLAGSAFTTNVHAGQAGHKQSHGEWETCDQRKQTAQNLVPFLHAPNSLCLFSSRSGGSKTHAALRHSTRTAGISWLQLPDFPVLYPVSRATGRSGDLALTSQTARAMPPSREQACPWACAPSPSPSNTKAHRHLSNHLPRSASTDQSIPHRQGREMDPGRQSQNGHANLQDSHNTTGSSHTGTEQVFYGERVSKQLYQLSNSRTRRMTTGSKTPRCKPKRLLSPGHVTAARQSSWIESQRQTRCCELPASPTPA